MSDTPKIYYRITEAAELLGVEPSTLRWWEREIDALKPVRTPGGRRRYTAEDLETARKIKTLVYERGLRLEAVSNFLKESAPKAYRLYCRNSKEALNLLTQLKDYLVDNQHALDICKALTKYLERNQN